MALLEGESVGVGHDLVISDPRRGRSDTLFVVGKVASIAGIVLGVVAGCSSPSSSSGTLAPSPIDAEGTPAVPPREGTAKRPPPPSESGEQSKGCPSSRTDAAVELTAGADLRARLPGIYRSCDGYGGIELRLAPDDEMRVVFYPLDDRFVRVAGSNGGYFDVTECDGASCSSEWYEDEGGGTPTTSTRTITLWSEPTAVMVERSNGASWTEWVRVAD